MSVKPIPEGYHAITPYLMVKGASEFIEFTQNAFGAKELNRMADDNGTIMHAEVQIGDSRFMLSEASEVSPPSKIMLHLYVENVDDVFNQAVKSGASSFAEPEDQFYGDRGGGLKDKFGIHWWISTHIEDVPPEEMKKREEEWKKKQKK